MSWSYERRTRRDKCIPVGTVAELGRMSTAIWNHIRPVVGRVGPDADSETVFDVPVWIHSDVRNLSQGVQCHSPMLAIWFLGTNVPREINRTIGFSWQRIIFFPALDVTYFIVVMSLMKESWVEGFCAASFPDSEFPSDPLVRCRSRLPVTLPRSYM